MPYNSIDWNKARWGQSKRSACTPVKQTLHLIYHVCICAGACASNRPVAHGVLKAYNGNVVCRLRRNMCAKEDLYYPHPLIQDVLW